MTLRLIDVSSNNGPVDWAAVAAAGVAGAICKLVEGVGYTDGQAATNYHGIRATGLWRASYAFARLELGNGPEAEADYYLSVLGGDVQSYDAVALDIETPTGPGTEDYSPWALAWLGRVEAALGFPPMVYSYPDFIRRHLSDPRLGRYPLWLAAYDGQLPASIGPWASIALWQHTDSATCPGVAGHVDESLIARDLAGLRLLGKPAPTPPAPPTAPAPVTATVYEVATPHYLRVTPRRAAAHVEATVMAVGELLDANAAPPPGLPSWTTAFRWCRRRATGAFGYAFAPNLQAAIAHSSTPVSSPGVGQSSGAFGYALAVNLHPAQA